MCEIPTARRNFDLGTTIIKRKAILEKLKETDKLVMGIIGRPTLGSLDNEMKLKIWLLKTVSRLICELRRRITAEHGNNQITVRTSVWNSLIDADEICRVLMRNADDAAMTKYVSGHREPTADEIRDSHKRMFDLDRETPPAAAEDV